MAPGRLLRHCFDLCFVPRHDQLEEGGNIMLTDGPPGLNSNRRKHDPSQGLVLVGGVDEKSHVWDNVEMARRVTSLLSQHPHLSWTLTTSPRTPKNFLAVFAETAESRSVQIRPFEETPPGWLEQALERSKYVAVTEDSMSMVFEALSAGCRVITVPVDFKKNNKFSRSLYELKKRNLLAVDLKTQESVESEMNFDIAGQCAAEMEKRWWSNS
jgi:mitochondrial fission protein ELM1